MKSQVCWVEKDAWHVFIRSSDSQHASRIRKMTFQALASMKMQVKSERDGWHCFKSAWSLVLSAQ